MPLRKFREFVRDRHGSVSKRLELKALDEETHDSDITDAATVIIGSELSAGERMSLADSFINHMRMMSEAGGTIIATAVAFE